MGGWKTWDGTTRGMLVVSMLFLLAGIVSQVYGMAVPEADGWHPQILIGIGIVLYFATTARVRRQDKDRR